MNDQDLFRHQVMERIIESRQLQAERDNPHLTADEVQLLIMSGQLSTAKVESDMDWGGAIAFAIIAILVAVATYLLR